LTNGKIEMDSRFKKMDITIKHWLPFLTPILLSNFKLSDFENTSTL
jgi:hypothetical protein